MIGSKACLRNTAMSCGFDQLLVSVRLGVAFSGYASLSCIVSFPSLLIFLVREEETNARKRRGMGRAAHTLFLFSTGCLGGGCNMFQLELGKKCSNSK